MDKFEQLVNGECAAAVIGNPVTGQYALIDMDDAPMSEAAIQEARQRGFEFVGMLGIKNGVADALCEPGAGALAVMCHAVLPFVTQYAARLGPKGDGADWLQALYNLPDTRTGEN